MFKSTHTLGVSQIAEKFELLKNLAQLVDNPEFAVLPMDLSSLLMDLALLVLNQQASNVKLNDEVFEDPFDRTDCLGNVRMIHKRNFSLSNPELYQWLGENLADLAHQFQKKVLEQSKTQEGWKQLDWEIDMFDDLESENLLAAKRRIVFLRKEISNMDRRNYKLSCRLSKLQDKYRKSKKNQSMDQFPLTKHLQHRKDLGFMPSYSSKSKKLTRNESSDRKDDSQLDCLKW